MTYTDFTRRAFPAAMLIALLCAGWALRSSPPAPPAPPAQVTAPGDSPPRPHIPAPPPESVAAPVMFPPAGAVLTATPGPGPESLPPARETAPSKVWLSEFDRALDKEFSRIEAREKTSRDPVELAVMERLKAKLLALDELWGRADQATSADEKVRLQQEAQQIMGEIIQLGRADRNQRLTGIAKQVGLVNSADISRFIEDVDRAMIETQLDWAPLFNRGVETPTEETVR